MRGFPKHFETKEDYMNTLLMYPEQTKKALRSLYQDRFILVKDKELKNKADGIEDAKHIVSEEKTEDGKIKYYQCSFKNNPNARYLRLGFTEEEILNLIKR